MFLDATFVSADSFWGVWEKGEVEGKSYAGTKVISLHLFSRRRNRRDINVNLIERAKTARRDDKIPRVRLFSRSENVVIKIEIGF